MEKATSVICNDRPTTLIPSILFIMNNHTISTRKIENNGVNQCVVLDCHLLVKVTTNNKQLHNSETASNQLELFLEFRLCRVVLWRTDPCTKRSAFFTNKLYVCPTDTTVNLVIYLSQLKATKPLVTALRI